MVGGSMETRAPKREFAPSYTYIYFIYFDRNLKSISDRRKFFLIYFIYFDRNRKPISDRRKFSLDTDVRQLYVIFLVSIVNSLPQTLQGEPWRC